MRDVISLSAYPKSGVTYLEALLFHSLFAGDLFTGGGASIHAMERRHIIDIHAYPAADFADPAGPRLIKSHHPFDPGRPWNGRTGRAVYLIRHPIDVMASAWDYLWLVRPDRPPPPFDAFTDGWLDSGGAATFPEAGPWGAHVRSWLEQDAIPVHRVAYTALVDDPDRELAAILAFLGQAVPAERRAQAIARSSLPAMAALEAEEVRTRTEGLFYRPALAEGYRRGARFVNQGRRGSALSRLDPARRARAEGVFGAEIAAHLPEEVQPGGGQPGGGQPWR